MTETLIALLLRLSEGAGPASLPGPLARKYFGREFELLLSVGALEEQAPAEYWPVCTGCECELDARPIEAIGGSMVAVCPLDATAAVALDDEDRRSFQIHPCRVVGALADGSAALSEPLPGLWHLGRRLGGREIFVTLTRSVVANPALPAIVATHARGPAALIGPRPTGGPAVRLKEARIVLVPSSEVIGLDMGGRLRLDDAAVAGLIRGGPAQLEVRVADGVVLIDGTRQHVPERPFELLRRLVEQTCGRGGPINNQEFESFTGRSASDVLRELKRALKRHRSNAAEIEAWFVARRTAGGYELVLDPSQIELLP